jgi:N-acetylglucosamine-6-phosphate deacetylase
MDHMVATFHRLTGAPLPEVVRMASLTPARIIGKEADFGSIAEGKRADLVVLGSDLKVKRVFRDGESLP